MSNRGKLARVLAAGALAAGLGGVVGPSAARADNSCNGTVTQVGDLYFDQRNNPDADVDMWLYRESNGEPGLQSGGSSPTGLYDDYCQHENPDTMIF